jgi:uncharacterized protein
MIAVDTNLLVYAHREDLPWHSAAAQRLIWLAESRDRWAIPWPCAHEFFAKVTHPRIFPRPSSAADALAFIAELSRSPTLQFLAESDEYWSLLDRMVRSSRVVGPMIHDARIAALCVLHGVSELWSADRDFGRFSQLRVRNPLIVE